MNSDADRISGSEHLGGSRFVRDLVPALHEMRWSCLTDRIGREVRLGTLPQPAAMSRSTPLMRATLYLPRGPPKGAATPTSGGLQLAIWGEMLSQTCRASCPPGGCRNL